MYEINLARSIACNGKNIHVGALSIDYVLGVHRSDTLRYCRKTMDARNERSMQKKNRELIDS